MLLQLFIIGIIIYFIWHFLHKPKNTDKEQTSDNPSPEASPKPKFCSDCGTPLGENDQFCPICGTKVIHINRSPKNNHPSKKAPTYPAPSREKKEGNNA